MQPVGVESLSAISGANPPKRMVANSRLTAAPESSTRWIKCVVEMPPVRGAET